MNKIYFFILLSTATLTFGGWNQPSPQAAEKQRIYQQIASINNQYSARSSARTGAIFAYLKNLNTPISYEVLKEMVETGQLPAHFLNMA